MRAVCCTVVEPPEPNILKSIWYSQATAFSMSAMLWRKMLQTSHTNECQVSGFVINPDIPYMLNAHFVCATVCRLIGPIPWSQWKRTISCLLCTRCRMMGVRCWLWHVSAGVPVRQNERVVCCSNDNNYCEFKWLYLKCLKIKCSTVKSLVLSSLQATCQR